MKPQVHHIFFSIGLVFGVIILWLTPPFQSPDETNHYHRSAHIASGHLMGDVRDGNRLGGEIDGSLLTYTMYFDSIRQSVDPTFDDRDFVYGRGLTHTGDTFVDFANVGYCPYLSLYLTRLVSLLVWLTLIGLAIKIIPIQKVLFAYLALLPSSMSLASCVSGDTFTSSMSYLWVALLLRGILTDHRVSTREFIMLCIITGLITVNKVVYFPLVLMILLVPSERLNRGNLSKGIILLLTLLMLLLWIPYSGSLFIPYSEYSPIYREMQQLNPPAHPRAQLAWILAHPLTFTQVLVTSYLDSAPATIAHFIGKYGWDHRYLHPVMLGLLGLGVGILSLSRAEMQPRLNPKARIILISIGLVMLAGLSVSLYMQWSPVGHYRIRSLSGRYLIPIMPVMLIALSQITYQRQRLVDLIAGVLSVIGLVSLVIGMYVTWY